MMYMGVSIHGATPKSSILDGIFRFEPSNYGGTPIDGNPHLQFLVDLYMHIQ